MATALLCRRALGRHVVPVALGLSSGAWMLRRQQPLRLDAVRESRPANAPLSRADPVAAEKLDPTTLKQISGGSLTGFVAGLLVSVFSRTLVLVIGLAIVTVQVASRYGIDVVKHFGLKERARASRILSALGQNTPYKLSFGVTFAMSAFMRF